MSGACNTIEGEKKGIQNIYLRVSVFLIRLGVGRCLRTETNLNLHCSPNIFGRII